MLAMGIASAQQIDVTATKPNVGKMLPRVEQMGIESNAIHYAPRKAVGDEIAHWTLNTFEEFDLLMSMTLIDANDDGYGWGGMSSGTNLNVLCTSNPDQDNDDWLITPGVTLEAGKRYQVSVQLRGRKATRLCEIMAGQEATVEGMTIRVCDVQEVPTDVYHMYKGTFAAETDGEYVIGFHDVSAGVSSAYLYLADIIISEAAPGDAPAAVSDLTVIPGENAALTADIHFTLPTLNLAGEELTAIDRIGWRHVPADLLQRYHPGPQLQGEHGGCPRAQAVVQALDREWIPDYADTRLQCRLLAHRDSL